MPKNGLITKEGRGSEIYSLPEQDRITLINCLLIIATPDQALKKRYLEELNTRVFTELSNRAKKALHS